MGLKRINTAPLTNTEFARTLRLMHHTKDPRLSMTLRVAWGDGWTKPVLADILGVTRQAIQLRIRTAPFFPVDELPEIPPPPKRPGPKPKPPKPDLRVYPEVADRLRYLYKLAKTVNGSMRANHPARLASEELAETLSKLVQDKVRRAHLAEVLGCTTMAISLRLARHGYTAAPVRRQPTEPPMYEDINLRRGDES